jgi:hypothetical protein
MTLFTVHIPVGARDPERIAEQVRVVPEKASFAAFLFGPVWLAAQGAWWAAGGFALAMGALLGAQMALDLSAGGLLATLLLVQLFIGVEGHQFARAAASRGGFELLDVVQAASADAAEHIALHRLISASTQQPARPAAPTYMRDNDLPGIGLFPGAGG